MANRLIASVTSAASAVAALSFPFALLYPVMDILDSGNQIGWGTKLFVLASVPLYVATAAVSLSLAVAVDRRPRRRANALILLGSVLAVALVGGFILDATENRLNLSETLPYRIVLLVVCCLSLTTALLAHLRNGSDQ